MVIVIIYLILFLNKRPKKIAKEKELEACAEKNPYFPPQFSFTSLKESDIEFICSKHDCTFLDTKKILGDWCKDVKFIKINIHEYDRTKRFINKEE